MNNLIPQSSILAWWKPDNFFSSTYLLDAGPGGVHLNSASISYAPYAGSHPTTFAPTLSFSSGLQYLFSSRNLSLFAIGSSGLTVIVAVSPSDSLYPQSILAENTGTGARKQWGAGVAFIQSRRA